MTPASEGFSIVIVGRWNPFIFSPDWVTTHLRDGDDTAVRIGIPVDNAEGPRQIAFEHTRLYPSTTRLDIRPEAPALDQMREIERTARKVLDLLPHTPVSALGINFEFHEQAEREAIQSNFVLSDAGQIDASAYQLTQTRLRRAFSARGQSTLNLTITWDSSMVSTDFNFHKEIPNAHAAIAALDEVPVADRYTEAVRFLERVYGLEVEETSGDDDDHAQEESV